MPEVLVSSRNTQGCFSWRRPSRWQLYFLFLAISFLLFWLYISTYPPHSHFSPSYFAHKLASNSPTSSSSPSLSNVLDYFLSRLQRESQIVKEEGGRVRERQQHLKELEEEFARGLKDFLEQEEEEEEVEEEEEEEKREEKIRGEKRSGKREKKAQKFEVKKEKKRLKKEKQQKREIKLQQKQEKKKLKKLQKQLAGEETERTALTQRQKEMRVRQNVLSKITRREARLRENTTPYNCSFQFSSERIQIPFAPPEVEDGLRSKVREVLLDSPEGTFLIPNFTNIWLAGFSPATASPQSWVQELPMLFVYRYPNSRFFLIRQGTKPTEPLEIEIILPKYRKPGEEEAEEFEEEGSERTEEKEEGDSEEGEGEVETPFFFSRPGPDSHTIVNRNFSSFPRTLTRLPIVFKPTIYTEEEQEGEPMILIRRRKEIQVRKKEAIFSGTPEELAQAFPPDLSFIRNAFQVQKPISEQAPSLLSPGVLRVVYPVLGVTFPEAVDFTFQTDKFPKVIPQWQLKVYKDVIKRRIMMEKRFELTAAGRALLMSAFPGRSDFKPENLGTEELQILGIDSSESYDRSGFSNVRVKKENFIFYPATIHPRKGQLSFVELVDTCIFEKHNITLRIAGRWSGTYTKYWDQLKAKLEERRIPYEFLGYIKDREQLIEQYVDSRVVVELGLREDPGPRTVYEGIYGNTPFLVNSWVELAQDISHLGLRIDKDSTGQETTEALDRILQMDWDDIPISYARKHLTTETAYGRVFNEIDLMFCAKYTEKCVPEQQQ